MKKMNKKKMEKMKKWRKNDEKKKRRKMKKMDFTRKVLDDFQGFAVVVVTFFRQNSSTIFHDFCFGMCVSSIPEENQQPVFGVLTVFSEEKVDNVHWT